MLFVGAEGKVDESLKAMSEIDQLKIEKRNAEVKRVVCVYKVLILEQVVVARSTNLSK